MTWVDQGCTTITSPYKTLSSAKRMPDRDWPVPRHLPLPFPLGNNMAARSACWSRCSGLELVSKAQRPEIFSRADIRWLTEGRLVSLPSQGFPGGSDSKEAACNAGDLNLIPGWERSPGEGNGYPVQYSYLENSMDKAAWWATVCGVSKSWTQLKRLTLSLVFLYSNHERILKNQPMLCL